MLIKSVEIEKFRAFSNVCFKLGKKITAISGRNTTQKTTLLGLIGQPFTISSKSPMFGCQTIDGYNFRSQFSEKFKISPKYDIIGEHKWKLFFHHGIYHKDYFSIESIARSQNGSKKLRFWNAESRSRGAGYVQLPVYFLSLSRLFPIGESKKTKSLPIAFSTEEANYCIRNYREILSIHQNNEESASVNLEKGSSSRTFSGVSDNLHDIFTNSAGEGNVTRIILAVLSFKRLKEKYGKIYKGGVLLIDELESTLHGFSQRKLVDFLYKASNDYKIQIVFTTHSPIILQQVFNHLQEELKNTEFKEFYDSSILYLEPEFDDTGNRRIIANNIDNLIKLNRVLGDINLTIPKKQKLNIYCEDNRAVSFLRYSLSSSLGINIDQYMSIIDIDLGWPNYVQLARKSIPEFTHNIIVLDEDVKYKPEYKKNRTKEFIDESGNFIFLPLTIEEDLFKLLRNHEIFNRFKENFSNVEELTYDICFSDWPLQVDEYKTIDFKAWYKQIEDILGDQTILFSFWISENKNKQELFIENFKETFNEIAKKNGYRNLI